MNNLIPNFTVITPEIIILVMSCVVLLVDLFTKGKIKTLTYFLSQTALIFAFAATFKNLAIAKVITFHGAFVHDGLASILKLAIFFVVFLCFWYAHQIFKTEQKEQGEFYILSLLSVLGMMVMISGHDLLIIYLGLEVLSLPLYAMVAMKKDQRDASEAALKYFITGSIASAILLFGMSMIFGATATLDISSIARVISVTPSGVNLIFAFGLVFVVMGVAFKLAAVPFHMWIPDVYQGTPNAMLLFLSSAPKIAAFGMLIRLLVEAMPNLFHQWQEILIILSILSIAVGNLTAIMQTNIKRMLAYSAIAHSGYLLLGLLSGTSEGYSASMFYIIAYSLMSLGAFAVIGLMSRTEHEIKNLDDFKGLNSRNPWLAFMMLILMFSMAGIPPTAGFFAKVGVIQALVNSHLTWLAVYAVVFAVIGAFYYLRIINFMYFKSADKTEKVFLTRNELTAITINSFAVLGLGIFPSLLISLCKNIFLN